MAKLVKNNTANPLVINDTGVTIPASGQHTITTGEEFLWASSNDLITELGNNNATVNDGTNDLSDSDGLDLIKGIFPKKIKITDGTNDASIIDDAGTKRIAVDANFSVSSLKIKGDTDDTLIGNVGDRLKVSSTHDEDDVGQPNPITIADSFQLCPFGRLRVSNPVNIFEYKFRSGENSNIWVDKFVGGAVKQFNTALHPVSLGLHNTTAQGDKGILSTRRYIRYAPGKGLLHFITGNLHGAQTGVTKHIGSFDDEDGFIFNTKDEIVNVISRSNVTGSVVDEIVDQASWNVDTFDGSKDVNNPSGLLLDITKQQIFVIDIQWLASGRVRMGLEIGGRILFCHFFDKSNKLTTPYSTSADLPIRLEIENHGTPTTVNHIHLTCVACIRDGGDDIVSSSVFLSSGVSEITVDSNFTHIFSIRMNPNNNRFSLLPQDFSMIMTSGTKFLYYQLLLNPTLTSPTWISKGQVSEVCLDTATSGFSGGVVVLDGHINVGGSTTISDFEKRLGTLFLGRDIDGVSDILTLVTKTSGGTAKLVYNGNFEEEV